MLPTSSEWPSPAASRLVFGLRAIAVLGLFAIPINHSILKRLLAIVGTVRARDPFVAANALRLRTIAWALLALQLLSLVIAAIEQVLAGPHLPAVTVPGDDDVLPGGHLAAG